MKYILLLLWLTANLVSSACDICNMYSGVLPDDYRNTVGVFHRTRRLDGVMTTQGVVRAPGVMRHGGHINIDNLLLNGNEEFSVKEIYSVSEFRLRLQFSDRVSVMALLPIVSNLRYINETLAARAGGLGDIAFLGGYQVLNTISAKAEKKFRHRMALHGGFRLPSGAATRQYNDKLLDVDMQPGKRAFDAVAMLEYVSMFGKTGWMFMGSSRVNLLSMSNYVYGNAFNVNMYCFRKIKINDDYAIFPRLGAIYENAMKDYWMREKILDTGGQVVMADFGIDLYSGSFSIGLAYQKAVINRWGSGQIPVTHRIQAQMQIIF